MATWENEFTTPGSSARIWLVAEVTYGAYDIALNRTPYNWYLRGEERVNASPFNLNGVSSGAMAVNGVTVFSSGGLNYDYRATNATNYIASGSGYITHEADGTKTITITASFNGGDSVLGTASISASLVLPTIPRATTPELSSTSIDAGVGITIDLPRASTSFTHDLSYSFEGGSSVSIATGVATSQAFTPPLSLLNDIPNSPFGTAVITVVTKNGGTTIGTKTVNLTVTVPAAGIPDFAITSVAETVAAIITMMGGSTGPFLRSNSKPIVTLSTPTGYYGSTIASTKIEIGTQPAINGGAWTSGTRTGTLVEAINQFGAAVVVKVTVTDTRGKSRERTTTINVLNYTAPVANTVTFKRSTSGGVESILGTYLKIAHSSSVASVISGTEKNAIKYRVDFKLKASPTFTNGAVQTPGGRTYSTPILQSGFLAGAAYDVRLVILDNTGTLTIVEGSLSTAQVALNINPAGTGVGIGKIYEPGRGSLDVLNDAYVRDGARVLSEDDFATGADVVNQVENDLIVTPLSLKSRFAYGVISTTWTSGLAPVTLSDGTLVNAQYSPNDRDLQPGATVKLEKLDSGVWVIDTAAYASVLDYPRWVPLTLQNGWVRHGGQLNFGALGETFNYAPAKVTRTEAGYVELQGGLARPAGGAASGSIITNLPVPFRPLVDHRFVVWSGGSLCIVDVLTNGNVVLQTASAGDLFLDNIHFNNDPALSWTAITYSAGFSNFSGFPVLLAKDTYGQVFMRGSTQGTAATGAIAAAFPAGMRQNAGLGTNIYFGALGVGTINRIDTHAGGAPNGIFDQYAGSANTRLALDQVSWLADGFSQHPEVATTVQSGFTSLGYQVFTFASGSDYGSGFTGRRFTMLPDRRVKLDGLVQGISVGSIVGYLPVGMRPKYARLLLVEAVDTLAVWYILPNGAIIYASGGTTWISLASIQFIAEQ